MGGGIAQVLALAGHTVRIADISEEIARANLARLDKETAEFVADGLFPADAVEGVRAHISAAASIEEAVAGADFIEEAVPEKIEIKHDTLRRISAAARPDAVIGSNTSTILIGSLAEAVTGPERFLGVHFSNPAPFIPGVEVIPHETTGADAVALASAVVESTGKLAAPVKDATGFVLNRLQYALFEEAAKIADEGIASPTDIDTIVRTTFGFRLPFFGPFAIADMAGLDVYAFCFESLQTRWPERFATPPSLKEHVDAGEFGTKSGAGYLDIPAGRTPELVAYRNRAYVAMQKLLDDLGPAPL
ncbi:MAG: 3-hydroxyacyl-CoA dehydrogenase family protein [Humibacter sp.]